MRRMLRATSTVIAFAAAGLIAVGCGSSGTSHSAASTQGTQPSSTGGGSSAGALAAEATSAATGDIPDKQVYLTYRNPVGGYAMSYPEGWAIKAHGADVTIANRNNIVRVVVSGAGTPTATGLVAELARLKRSNPTLKYSPPSGIRVKAGPAVKTTYTTRSGQNPVTGKSILLVVDRYELSKAAKRATVDLGTPKGVDNVDAYRMIINSFRWL
jgi:hypothetical protein